MNPTIDPRADSEEKLTPPAPLPFVSRKALARVKGHISPPVRCPYCFGQIRLVNHKEIYGREYSEWPYIYDCRACDAYVGLHPKTDLPLGTMANRALREARKTHKAKFIELMKRRGWNRDVAYRWLTEAMGLQEGQCHWGWFNIAQCEAAGLVVEQELIKQRG